VDDPDPRRRTKRRRRKKEKGIRNEATTKPAKTVHFHKTPQRSFLSGPPEEEM